MRARRLEDRIKELCARLLIEREPHWSNTARKLQMALEEHNLRNENFNARLVDTGRTIVERRRD